MRLSFIAVAAVVGIGLVGCKSADSDNVNVGSKPVDEQIKGIESRKDMPEQAKAMAVQQLKAGQQAAVDQHQGATAAGK